MYITFCVIAIICVNFCVNCDSRLCIILGPKQRDPSEFQSFMNHDPLPFWMPNAITRHRCNKHRDRGRVCPPYFRLGTNNALPPPNFLAVVFKKQEISQPVVTRMQDLARVFKNFPGATPSHTQHPAQPLARRGAQAQTLVPLKFSAVVAPLLLDDDTVCC